MKKATTRNKKRITLDDGAFVSRLIELGENRAALARELGITPSAVTQRMKKLDPDGKRLAVARESGRVAALVQNATDDNTSSQAVEIAGFKAGVEDVARQYHVRNRLAEYGHVIDKLLAILVQEVEMMSLSPRAKLRPFQVDLCCKLVMAGTKIATSLHSVRRDLLKTEEYEKFVRLVGGVILSQSPDIRMQLYDALQNGGAENQAELLGRSEDSTET